ncbi:MAG TPA: MFS transporter [Kofleriaceae bacterium]|nr:MFS transporter [Kofleriaceae bacterium]
MSPLWRHRAFRRLWAAETISQLGSQITVIALPLLAIAIHADVVELGVLAALEFAPFVLFGLLAGAWIDRLPRRPVLVIADLGRAVVLGSIPLGAALGVLSIAQLYVVAFLAGTLSVMFDVAYESFLPGLIGRDDLVDGNAKLELSRSGAQIAGPTLGGTLVGLLSAPAAILLDAASFVGSALFIFGIPSENRTSGPAADRARRSIWSDIREGLGYVLGQRYLRSIACCTATANLFSGIMSALLVAYLVREVGLGATEVGVVLGVGNVGFVIGAVLSDRARAWLGVGPVIVLAAAVAGAAAFLIPAAPHAHAAGFVAAGQLGIGLGASVYNINQVSLRQAIVPDRLRSRLTATMRFVVWGTLPIGTVGGGLLGRAIGMGPALWVAAIGGTASFAWVALSPVRRLMETPPPDPG